MTKAPAPERDPGPSGVYGFEMPGELAAGAFWQGDDAWRDTWHERRFWFEAWAQRVPDPARGELLAEYEWHGLRFVPHLVLDASPSDSTIASDAVRKRFARSLDRAERGWRISPVDVPMVSCVADASDVLDAMRRLHARGLEVPTYRAFARMVLPLLPHLREREELALWMQTRGRGPRACERCADDREEGLWR